MLRIAVTSAPSQGIIRRMQSLLYSSSRILQVKKKWASIIMYVLPAKLAKSSRHGHAGAAARPVRWVTMIAQKNTV